MWACFGAGCASKLSVKFGQVWRRLEREVSLPCHAVRTWKMMMMWPQAARAQIAETLKSCLAWTWECWYCTLIFDDFWMFLNHKRDQRCRSRGMDLRLFGCQDLALGHLNHRWNKDKNSWMTRTARMAHLTFHCRIYCRRHSLRKL